MDESIIWTPPVAFYFSVRFEGYLSVAFQEVSGLQLEMETETVKEGGENSFSYQLPVRRKHGNLVLKRSLMPVSRSLESYIVDVLENNGSSLINPISVTIILNNALHLPQNAWMALNAYPVKWEASPFGSLKNEIVVETIELAYNNLVRIM